MLAHKQFRGMVSIDDLHWLFKKTLKFKMADGRHFNKKLSCRRETVRRFVSLNILLSHSRSFEMTLLSRACMQVPISIPLKLCISYRYCRYSTRDFETE